MKIPMRALDILGICLAVGTGWSCTTTESLSVEQSPLVSRARAVRAWELVEEGPRAVGILVQFRGIEDPEQFFYSVRNLHLQDLGMIDSQGRTWRYRPHEREAEWLWTGTVAEGARRILGASSASVLREVDLASLGREMPSPRD